MRAGRRLAAGAAVRCVSALVLACAVAPGPASGPQVLAAPGGDDGGRWFATAYGMTLRLATASIGGVPGLVAAGAEAAALSWADGRLGREDPAGRGGEAARAAAGGASWERRLMQAVTDAGSPVGQCAFVLAVAAFDPAAALRAAIAESGALATTLAHKVTIGRARPVVARGALSYEGPGPAGDAFESLPSGHTSGATAVAVALGAGFPQAAPFLRAWAVLVGLSRLYLGLHWPADVGAGAALGEWWGHAAWGAGGGASR